MTPERFWELTGSFAQLKIAVVGDFCLDRYLEIDPSRAEVSIETGLPVHNVTRVRAQPGGAGTILNNLVALGTGEMHPVGFCGEDGEGFELLRALGKLRGVCADGMLQTSLRHTFTYCKPLVVEEGKEPVELNRLDTKSWTQTPAEVEDELIRRLRELAPRVQAIILLDQVSLPDTGVITFRLLEAIASLVREYPSLWILADSRRSLRGFPPVCFKMNRAELQALVGVEGELSLVSAREHAADLARRQGRPVFVTLSEEGLLAAGPDGEVEQVSALPVRGPIDIVGAGDCVTACLTAALSAGASLHEALELAGAASSIVIHQLGTTGAASPEQIAALLGCG